MQDSGFSHLFWQASDFYSDSSSCSFWLNNCYSSVMMGCYCDSFHVFPHCAFPMVTSIANNVCHEEVSYIFEEGCDHDEEGLENDDVHDTVIY